MPKNLENLTIHAFRGLRELSLPQLGQINLFVGPNNSGKTSALEAIGLFSRPLDPIEWLQTARRREIKSSRQSQVESLKWLFPRNGRVLGSLDDHGDIYLSATGEFPNLELRAHYEEFVAYLENAEGAESPEEEDGSESGVDIGDWPSGVHLRLAVRVPEASWTRFQAHPVSGMVSADFHLFEDERFVSRRTPEGPYLELATVSPFAHRVEQWQVGQLTAVRMADSKQKLLAVVQMFDEDVLDLEVLSRRGVRPMVYVKHRRLGLSPLSSFGDGLRRALAIASNLVGVEHGILLVDEIETAVHFSALGELFEWLVKACLEYDVQLFATTHSLEAVDAMILGGKVALERVAAYHLEYTPEGSVARRYGGELLHRLRYERGLDVR